MCCSSLEKLHLHIKICQKRLDSESGETALGQLPSHVVNVALLHALLMHRLCVQGGVRGTVRRRGLPRLDSGSPESLPGAGRRCLVMQPEQPGMRTCMHTFIHINVCVYVCFSVCAFAARTYYMADGRSNNKETGSKSFQRCPRKLEGKRTIN